MQLVIAVTLSLLISSLHADELFPVIEAKDAHAVALKQVALGLADTPFVAAMALLLLKDWRPTEVRSRHRAADRISRKLENLNRRRYFANPIHREVAIQNSLATTAEQEGVARAAQDLERAKDLLTETMRRERVTQEMWLMAHGDGLTNSPPNFHAPSAYLTTVSATERAEAIAAAEKSLAAAEEKLIGAVTQRGGTWEQIAEFSAVGRVARLEKQLADLQNPSVIRKFAAKEEQLALKIFRMEKIKAHFRADAEALAISPPGLKRFLSFPAPLITSVALLPLAMDPLMRLALYFRGRDPGISPLATYLQAQLGQTCRDCGKNP